MNKQNDSNKKNNKRNEKKANSESRDSKEGSMSPIDLSKFMEEGEGEDEEGEELLTYVTNKTLQRGERAAHNHHNHHNQKNINNYNNNNNNVITIKTAGDDCMDWLDQATNDTTHYFTDPLDTFMQNFQQQANNASSAGIHGSALGEANEMHFSLDSKMFENDSERAMLNAGGVYKQQQYTNNNDAKNNDNDNKAQTSSGGGGGEKSNNKSSNNNNNKTNNSNSTVARSPSFTKPKKTNSFKKSNLSGSRKSSHVDLTTLEESMMHLNSNQMQPGIMRRIPSELRLQQLARYREKRARRKLGHKKIRYECRKTLADNRPRFKGRFAKILPNVASESNLSTMSAPEPGEGIAAMNDVLDSFDSKNKDKEEGISVEKKMEKTKQANRKIRASSRSKGSEETDDSGAAENDLFITREIPKKTRAMRRVQSSMGLLRTSQSEISLLKLVE